MGVCGTHSTKPAGTLEIAADALTPKFTQLQEYLAPKFTQLQEYLTPKFTQVTVAAPQLLLAAGSCALEAAAVTHAEVHAAAGVPHAEVHAAAGVPHAEARSRRR